MSAPERAHPSASRIDPQPRTRRPPRRIDATSNESKCFHSFTFVRFRPSRHRASLTGTDERTHSSFSRAALAGGVDESACVNEIPRRRASRRARNETKRNETYLGGSLGDERRGGDGASGGGRNGERHRRACASSVVTSAASTRGASRSTLSSVVVGGYFASRHSSIKKRQGKGLVLVVLLVDVCMYKQYLDVAFSFSGAARRANGWNCVWFNNATPLWY